MEGQEGHSLLFERMHSITGLPHCSIFLLQRHVQSGECLEIKKKIGMNKHIKTSIKTNQKPVVSQTSGAGTTALLKPQVNRFSSELEQEAQ